MVVVVGVAVAVAVAETGHAWSVVWFRPLFAAPWSEKDRARGLARPKWPEFVKREV